MPDPSSWEDLRDKFVARLQLLEVSGFEGTETETWNLFLNHPWYQAELQSLAERFLPARDQSDDLVVQGFKQNINHALLRKLERKGNLSYDASQHATFGNWMRAVIRAAYFDALREEKPRALLPDPRGTKWEPYDDPTRRRDIQIDIRAVIPKLDTRTLEVLVIYSHRFSYADVVRSLEISRDSAKRVVDSAQIRAQRLLTAYESSFSSRRPPPRKRP